MLSLKDFLKDAKIKYFGFAKSQEEKATTALAESTTLATVTVDVKWKESAVLNSYSSIEYYSEKTSVIKMADTGYYGLVDAKGNVVIQPAASQYFEHCSYGNGNIHYLLSPTDGGEGYEINMSTYKVSTEIHGGHGANEDTIPEGYDDIDRYFNGLAAVKKNGKWGYIDKSKNIVIPIEYEEVQKGFMTDNCRSFDGKYIPVKKNGKMGIVDKQNQIVVPFEYDIIMQGEDGIFIANRNGRWGFIGIGVEPKEPKKAVSAQKTPEWETNYLKTINDSAFENFNFILTDLDNNGVPDMILVMHRGTRGPITTVTMNGKFTDTYDEETGYFDYLYYSKQGKIATSSFYNYFETDPDTGKSYRNLDECFSHSYYQNGGIHDSDYVHRVTIYDRETDECIGVRYYKVDSNYNEVEISEAEFNVIYKDITDNYTKAYETSVDDFKSSGKSLRDFIQEF